MALRDLVKKIEDTHSKRTKLIERENYILGDHWNESRGWVGPVPPMDDPKSRDIMEEIRRGFVFRNLVLELCSRHRDSIVGREPQLSYTTEEPLQEDETLSSEDENLIREVDAAFTAWWDKKNAHKELQEAVLSLLWAKVDKRLSVSPIRFFIPESSLDANGNMLREDIDKVMMKIHFEAVSPLSAGIVYDSDGVEMASFYYFWDDLDERALEITATGRVIKKFGVELTRVPEDDDTVVLIMKEGVVIGQAFYKIGGRLMMHQMEREPFLTEGILSNQRMLNMALTMMNRNVILGGFLERVVLNAQVPGKWVDEEGNEDPMGNHFKPEPMNVGAGSTNFYTGIPMYDENGEIKGYSSPSINYRDPVSVETFERTMDKAEANMYREAKQAHAMISGDSTPSGESRIQAANDFVSSIGLTGSRVEEATRWILETLLSIASFFSTNSDRYQNLRGTAKARQSAVQPTNEEIKTLIEMSNALLISRETAMSKAGVEDTEAEKNKIQTEREEDIAMPELIPGALDESDESEEE